jgi:hypothetical protein
MENEGTNETIETGNSSTVVKTQPESTTDKSDAVTIVFTLILVALHSLSTGLQRAVIGLTRKAQEVRAWLHSVG